MLMSSSIDIDATIITLGFFYNFSLSLTFSTFDKAYLGMDFLPFSVLVVHVLDFSTLVSLGIFWHSLGKYPPLLPYLLPSRLPDVDYRCMCLLVLFLLFCFHHLLRSYCCSLVFQLNLDLLVLSSWGQVYL